MKGKKIGGYKAAFWLPIELVMNRLINFFSILPENEKNWKSWGFLILSPYCMLSSEGLQSVLFIVFCVHA
jgi:hypothetical protein